MSAVSQEMSFFVIKSDVKQIEVVEVNAPKSSICHKDKDNSTIEEATYP